MRHTRCALVTGVQTCALPISQTIDHDEHHQIQDKAADEGLQREAGISVLHHRSSPSAPAQESPMVVQLLRRRFRGQRKYKRAEPAIASASPPPANPISQGVLKSSWFFQSMMWRPQKDRKSTRLNYSH